MDIFSFFKMVTIFSCFPTFYDMLTEAQSDIFWRRNHKVELIVKLEYNTAEKLAEKHAVTIFSV